MDAFVTWATVAAGVMSVLTIVALVLRSRAWRGAERWWTSYGVAAVVLWLGVLIARVAPAVIDEMGLIFLGAMLLNLGVLALIVWERRRSESRGVKYRGSPLVWGVFGVVGAVLVLRFLELRLL
ncbi:hypothetical protein [Serinibacter arcticus]|uniref:Uncharacterized protein n=1 Tax=Serinibacter arcticus TaxID=1655435 RepID=A0A4Z1E3E8_9MICO|nr:hypothetical protein [Serinibacter arcticus]TGO05282.1 hypothetical protein SERN_1286 [Serinibacter arcticus]